MKDFYLKRQNHMEPNMRILNDMRKKLEELIHAEFLDFSDEWVNVVSEIIRFQSEDGSFNLLDSYQIESDCRVEFCHEPTYICTAILMRALIANREIFKGKEDVILSRALHMCCARGLQGHGFDGVKGYIKAVNYFIGCDVKSFLNKYPNMCEEFTEMFRKIRTDFAERITHENFRGAWGDDYEVEIRRIHDYFGETPIFVYGTLLKGQSNHNEYLSDSIFVGEGKIIGYEMYDLGCYPGIIAGNNRILGEVYYVTDVALKKIDRLEGEGSLYTKRPVIAKLENGKCLVAWVYIYNHSVDGCDRIEGRYGQDEMVWYVSYGSNMLEERFKNYIVGGTCLYNGKTYSSCTDRTLPCKSCTVEIPFDMYYSNYGMGAWADSAVSFLDLSKPGFSYGRAYKIKKKQLKEIHRKEGKNPNWYPECIRLKDIEGIPAYTFAGYELKNKEPFSKVSAEYGLVLYEGIKECYPELTNKDIFAYLQRCGI